MRTVLWWIAFVACICGFCVHFFFVELSNLPLNPLSAQLAKADDAYVEPYFRQQWNFFGPNPIDRNYSLVARARIKSGVPDKESETPWVNVTGLLIAAVRRNRFTPTFLVEIGLSNAVEDFVNVAGKDPRASDEKNGKRFFKSSIPLGVAPLSVEYMTRTSAATLQELYPDRKFEGIELGLFTHVFPRFLERFNRDQDNVGSLSTLPWEPFPQTVSY